MQLPKVIYFLREKVKSFFLRFYCLPSENLHKSNLVIVLFIVMQYFSKVHWLFDLAWYFKC